ncbi:MAG: lipid-A-disaccharide synthase N-terminal domain-containing protein [Rickettsiales bacterium]|nr:lipid-A-disaccharide synthase N-terminal domain-containing protein [Rickettsiales bacterium]
MYKENLWLIIGLLGQALFSMRFIIQWIISEKNKKSIIPISFWFFSISGGIVLLSYAIYKQDPVFIVGQGVGLIIYARNLWLIYVDKRKKILATIK